MEVALNLKDQAIEAITSVMKQGHPILTGYSGGKDSSTTLNLVLTAARGMRKQGLTVPPLIVLHVDTGIENPEMAAHVRREFMKIEAAAKESGLEVYTEISSPQAIDRWAVCTIGRRKRPAFPDSRDRTCTINWKVKNGDAARRRFVDRFSSLPSIVTMLGTRYEESASRAARMMLRGETSKDLWSGEDGSLRLSPIADWDAGDVWLYLADCREKREWSYSDFGDIFTLYKDGSGET